MPAPMRNFNLRRAALACAGGALLSLLGGAGQSATLKTGYYTIDAMAMGPDRVTIDASYTITWSDGLRNTAIDPVCFNTAVNLPNGATITKVTVWYTGAAGTETGAAVVRHQVSNGELRYVAEKVVGSSAGQRKNFGLTVAPVEALAAALVVPREIIDNARFSYAFGICLNGESKAAFHSARITYTYLD